MFEGSNYVGTREENYELLIKQLWHLTEDVSNPISNLSNAAALLNYFFDEINWVGFYLLSEGTLCLGPFQGLPACTHIPIGRGVCGTAAKEMKTMVVKNVHEFPGHIACDGASNSEIVVPILKENQLIGVLDIDSPKFDRFDEVDQHFLEKFVETLADRL